MSFKGKTISQLTLISFSDHGLFTNLQSCTASVVAWAPNTLSIISSLPIRYCCLWGWYYLQWTIEILKVSCTLNNFNSPSSFWRKGFGSLPKKISEKLFHLRTSQYLALVWTTVACCSSFTSNIYFFSDDKTRNFSFKALFKAYIQGWFAMRAAW